MESRLTPNISASLLAARLRRPQTNILTEECGFLTFAEKAWGKRGRGSVVNQLLSHEIPEWKLKDFTFADKVRRIYGATVFI